MEKRRWFSIDEYEERIRRVKQDMAARELDCLLLFQPESVTYLSGFFTRGYTSFQFLILPLDGSPIVVCRDMEAYYLETTYAFSDRFLWTDSDDKNQVMIAAIKKAGFANARLGLEKSAWQMNATRYEALAAGLPDAELLDIRDLVGRHTLIKSPAEIAYQRRAGKAAEAGMAAGAEHARVGVSERELAAAVCQAMILAGSDIPGPGVLSSGERALHLHGGYTDRVLKTGDTVQLETCPCVRHYHARFMRAMKVGRATDTEQALAENLIRIQDQAIAEVGPGVSASVPDHIYRENILSQALEKKYTNKTFYAVGFLLPPSGGQPLEAAPGCTWCFEAGMTFHTYLLVKGFGFSETILVTTDGFERLTQYPRKLIVT